MSLGDRSLPPAGEPISYSGNAWVLQGLGRMAHIALLGATFVGAVPGGPIYVEGAQRDGRPSVYRIAREDFDAGSSWDHECAADDCTTLVGGHPDEFPYCGACLAARLQPLDLP